MNIFYLHRPPQLESKKLQPAVKFDSAVKKLQKLNINEQIEEVQEEETPKKIFKTPVKPLKPQNSKPQRITTTTRSTRS